MDLGARRTRGLGDERLLNVGRECRPPQPPALDGFDRVGDEMDMVCFAQLGNDLRGMWHKIGRIAQARQMDAVARCRLKAADALGGEEKTGAWLKAKLTAFPMSNPQDAAEYILQEAKKERRDGRRDASPLHARHSALRYRESPNRRRSPPQNERPRLPLLRAGHGGYVPQ